MGVANATPAAGGEALGRTGFEPGRLAVTTALVESLLHDARNPLNAISIHLEVLGGKLRDDEGKLAPGLERNLRAMREQITRLDDLLRQFGDFLAPREGPPEPLDLSDLALRTVEVVGHAARSRRLALQVEVEREVWLSSAEHAGTCFLVLGLLLRGIRAANAGAELPVRLAREGDLVRLEVGSRTDGGEGAQVDPAAAVARAEAERLGVDLELWPAGGRLGFRLE